MVPTGAKTNRVMPTLRQLLAGTVDYFIFTAVDATQNLLEGFHRVTR